MALFTKAELAAFLQVTEASIDEATYTLIEKKIRVEIVNLIGQAKFDEAGEEPFFSVALDMAKRLYQNASGIRSQQETIDDYTRIDTYASETVQPFETSRDEQRRIRRAAGVGSAFSVVVRDECV